MQRVVAGASLVESNATIVVLYNILYIYMIFVLAQQMRNFLCFNRTYYKILLLFNYHLVHMIFDAILLLKM